MLGWRHRFRGLVLEEMDVQDAHRRFTALCLEQNLAGSGEDPESAIAALLRTVEAAAADEGLSKPDPDPALVQIYETRAPETPAGDRVVEWGWVLVGYAVTSRRPSRTKRRPKDVTFELCHA